MSGSLLYGLVDRTFGAGFQFNSIDLIIMKAALRLSLLIGVLGFSFLAEAQEVEWMTFEEATKASQKEPRKLLIDLYTDWCGWCKKMDRDAYANPVIAEYINKTYYPVKFNAEQTEDVKFKGRTFKFVPSGRKGYHELAAALANGKMSYPTTVFLDEKLNPIQPIPGYMTAKSIEPILYYFGEDAYKNKVPWKQFQENFKSSL